MKHTIFILCAALWIMAGCTNNKELSREEAMNLIRQEMHYPKVFDFEINRVTRTKLVKYWMQSWKQKG